MSSVLTGLGPGDEGVSLADALGSLDAVACAVAMFVDMRSLPNLVGSLPPETVSSCAEAASKNGENRPEVLRRLLLEHGEPQVEPVLHIEAAGAIDIDLVRAFVSAQKGAEKRPTRYLIHTNMPRTTTGSPDLAALAATPPHEYFVFGESLSTLEASQSAAPESARNLVVPIQTFGSRTPIFGLHNIGENASYYRSLAKHLGEDQPFYCLSAPRPFHLFEASDSVPDHPIEIPEIAASYIRDIERVAPTGPIILAGVCQGGVVAYEAAKQFTRRGRDVELMIMISDWHAPQSEYIDSASARAMERFRNIRAGGWSVVVDRVMTKDFLTQRLTYMRLSRLGEIVALRICRETSVDPPSRLLVREYIERTNNAVHSYRYQPYSGKTVVFRAEGDLRLPPEADLGSGGWGNLLADIEIIRTPGYNNPSMLGEPNVAVLANRLRSILDSAVQSR